MASGFEGSVRSLGPGERHGVSGNPDYRAPLATTALARRPGPLSLPNQDGQLRRTRKSADVGQELPRS